MSTPTTWTPNSLNSYHLQHQSALFRLPRELRDRIYGFYVYEEKGYVHGFESNKLRCSNGTAISLALMYTCKVAAEELDGLALQLNTITFRCGYSERDQGEFRGMKSRAGRFHCMRNYVKDTKMTMLLHAAHCFTQEMQNEVARRYPNVAHWFGEPYQFGRDNMVSWKLSGWCDLWEKDTPVEFEDALQCALELASTHKDFGHLTSRACGAQVEDGSYIGNKWRNYFIEDSSHTVMKWNPQPWAMPDEAELSTMEALLTEPLKLEHFEDTDFHRYHSKMKWYFSATATAVGFLRGLSKRHRSHLQRLSILENCKSVLSPESHSRGLVPYCVENRRLQVHTYISFRETICPPGWASINFERYRNGMESSMRGTVVAFGDWITEISKLPSLGMPAGSFRITLQETSEHTRQAWDFVKETAVLQEAFEEGHRRRGTRLPPWGCSDHIDHYPFFLPYPVPSIFYRTIKDIVQGTSFIHFEGDPGGLLDVDELADATENWSVREWRDRWCSFETDDDPEMPTEWREDLRLRYAI